MYSRTLSLLLLFIIVLESSSASQDAPTYVCTKTPFTRIKGNHGLLIIPRNETECGFLTQDGTQMFAIKTDNLDIRSGDKIAIRPDDSTESNVYLPPFDAGYLFSGLKEPVVTFSFDKTDNSTMEVEFIRNVTRLPVSGDMNNDFRITPLNVGHLDITFNKTIPDPIHFEVIGAKIQGTSIGHMLIESESLTIPIVFEGNQTVRIQTSPALSNCSGSFTDNSETSHEIIGPRAYQSRKGKYKCVNIYKTTMNQAQAHYEANFENFLDMVDVLDELVLDDGSTSNRLDIVKSRASDYYGQVFDFSGKDLAVIYTSPGAIAPSQIQFRLTVQAKSNGGIIKPGMIEFSANQADIRYVLQPEAQQYAVIYLPVDASLQGATMNVSIGNKVIAKFTEGFKLPPVLALDEPSAKMTLEFSVKNYKKLANMMTFKSIANNCHKITSSTNGGFSVIGGGRDPCYWTLASDKDVGLKFDYNDLIPNGCLTIQPLLQDKPIYSKCNLSLSEIIPTFILRQAYVTVTLPSNKTRLEASLSAFPYESVNHLEPTSYVDITSPGYNVSYAWSSEPQTFILNGTGKNYLLTIADVDLRTGERLSALGVDINDTNRSVLGDLFLSNSVANITVMRSSATNDFSHRRGFKIRATQYDQLIMADISKNVTTTAKNLTSVFVKISYPSKVASRFGMKIQYNVTFSSANKNFKIDIVDGRSIQKPSLTGNDSVYQGITTSDTLLISCKASSPSTTLPEMKVYYSSSQCGESDHVCDSYTRCVPNNHLCKGVSYCDDGSDLRLSCSSNGPAPKPRIIETGVGGVTVFILSMLMLALGAVSALYGPDLFKTVENRFRSGHYTAFTSTE